MLYRVARLLQLIGMLIVPLAMAGNLMAKLDVKEMLLLAALGVIIFYIGHALQKKVSA